MRSHGPGEAGAPPTVDQIETLNRLGETLTATQGIPVGYAAAMANIRRIVGAGLVELRVDESGSGAFAREGALVFASGEGPPDDARGMLTKWQAEHRRLGLFAGEEAIAPGWHAVSLPVGHLHEAFGALNLYFGDEAHWLIRDLRAGCGGQFVHSLAGQVTVLIHMRSGDQARILLKEVHHRIKNNLQTVASLLKMQARRLEDGDAARALRESVDRITAITAVHEVLCRRSLDLVDMTEVAGRIVALHAQGEARRSLGLEVTGPCTLMPSETATHLAMVLNELVQNAADHGLGDGAASVVVRLDCSEEEVRLSVVDDGPGLAPVLTRKMRVISACSYRG